MLVAAVDTATLTLSCALVEIDAGGARAIGVRNERAPARPAAPPAGHGVRLPGALMELLDETGLELRDVGGYAVGLGPGSFTGLRIGLATWKGLAYAQRRPIAGASSLAAMALGAVPGVQEGAVLVPVLDARKGEVYAGFYRRSGEALEAVAPEGAFAPGALLDRFASVARAPGAALAFGEGLAAHGLGPERIATLPSGPTTPDAVAVARLAAPRLHGVAFDRSALFALEPHYVRPSEAELKFPRGLGPGADG